MPGPSPKPAARNAGPRVRSAGGPAAAWLVCLVVFLSLVAARAQASTTTVGPGGVAPTLWYRAGDFNSVAGTWTDHSSSAVTASPPSGAVSPGALSQDANYNAGLRFDGATQWLRGSLSASAFAGANSYIFAVSNSSVAAPPATSFGDVLSGYNGASGPAQGLSFSNGFYGVDTSTNQGQGSFSVPAGTTIQSDDAYSAAGSGTGATISQNGISTSVSPAGAVTATAQFDLGGRTSNGATGNLFTGSIDEIVYYKNLAAALTATQIQQIRSYLAIKYGITLGYNAQTNTSVAENYYASNGAIIWTGNATYQHDMGAIGRDDASGLDQRVSHSINSVASGNTVDLTFSTGTSVSTASQTANAAFGSDKTFLVWGDNGGSTTMANYSGIYRMARVWLAQLTNTSQIAIQVPANTFTGIPNPQLWVSLGDPTFQTPAALVPIALTCNASFCGATVNASAPGSYYLSFGQVALSGAVFEDVNYGGGSGRAKSTAGCVGLAGVRVELYSQAGAFVSATTTVTGGSYVFLVNLSSTYTVRVVTPTTSSRTGGSTAGIIPVQTYRTTATSGIAVAVTDHVGGETPSLSDAAANTSNATLTSLTATGTTAQSIASAAVPSTSGIIGIDFGFNFDTIVNVNASGQGSFAQFLTNADALGGVAP